VLNEPRVLVVSFSPIARDSRVLRQISVVARHAHVTTIGYGDRPEGSDEHLRVPDSAASLPQTPSGVARLAARRFRAAEVAAPAATAALSLLQGRSFDLVVANDARALPVAHRAAAGAPVWADLHEWAPEERSHVTSWRLLVGPFMDYLCRVYLPRSAAVTTVGGSIADLYAQRYGVRPEVMRNAAPFADLAPTPVDGSQIRLVHSGGAVPGRHLETIIDAAIALGPGYSLDLFLVPANDSGRYLARLTERAAGHERVRINPPVTPDLLPHTLNRFDLGVYWMPPVNTNARLALPNKFFDFIQARLAIAVGPTLEMQRVVEQYGLGRVSDGFDVDACVASVRAMTREDIAGFKTASHDAARNLSFETDAAVGSAIVENLLRR
jgi:hypothetical protein